MINIEQIYTTNENYSFIENLLKESFPLQERRDSLLQRYYTDNKSHFHCNIIKDGEIPIGLITYWDFKDFIYIEHFAISPQYRNHGYGTKTLEALKYHTSTPLVLEAEEPINEQSKRRIEFYQRNGFKLEKHFYLQPPYREGDKWFPLKLMTFGIEDIESLFLFIKTQIYHHVYNQ